MNKAKELADSIVSLVEEFEEHTPELMGDLESDNSTSWSLHLDGDDVKIVMDLGSSIVFFNSDDLDRMKKAIDFFKMLEPKQRNIMMNLLEGTYEEGVIE